MSARRETLKALRFRDLAPYRVAEVLLVSSPYEAFILEQDGRLTEQVLLEYNELNLPTAPRFTHAPSGEAALKLLAERSFDLVITMTNLVDVDVNAFGHRVKALPPARPVVLLALDRKELRDRHDKIDGAAIDGAFLWNGDVTLFLAIIKYVEDRENVDHDIAHGSVKVIVVVEDSPSYYSALLGILYREVKKQARRLYAEGVNETLRQMYMKSRPKILHAASYDDGLRLVERYRDNLLAVVSDLGLPRGGELDPTAGIDLVRAARRSDPALPVLLHSSELLHVKAAQELGASFAWKSSPNLLREIRDFLTHRLGFGDFVFRDAGEREIDRARDLRELKEKLAAVPEESIAFHAARNDFSLWLTARSEFELAERIRPEKISDYRSIRAVRRHLIDVLRETERRTHRGVVSDFSRRRFVDEPFSRLGQGSLGGKARGLAFLNLQLAKMDAREIAGLAVKLPKTVVVASDHFDRFLRVNGLRRFAYASDDDAEITRRFLAGRLDERLLVDLELVARHLRTPLAVRSSSLLEDSMHQPMAGIYQTLMLPNNAAKTSDRLRDVADAVKLVYASTFLVNAKAYLRRSGNRVEDEKMAVIVQELAGRRYGERYYPCFSGVAQSFNFYPLGPQRAEDGIVHLALGLGRLVVDEGKAVRFSPRHPGVVPQLARAERRLDESQRGFYALDLAYRRSGADLHAAVRYFDLAAAEADGTLALAGSVYSADDQRLRDDLAAAGPRVVTFNNVLKHRAIPLPEAVAKLLEIGADGLGGAVEIELACDMGDWGYSVERGRQRTPPALYVLQIRPFARRGPADPPRVELGRDEVLCASSRSLGNGLREGIRDVVYVLRQRWDSAHNKAIAAEVGELNRELENEGRPYVLIGPGRWGTADPWLGIPVRWSQISSVRVIVEASPRGYDIELSQGTHFFQNITSLEIGFLSLPPGADKANAAGEDYIDWRWLDAQPAHRETEHVRRLRFDAPLTVVLDGPRGRGMIGKPGT